MSKTDTSLAIVLAAGQGTRMKSARAKVLHPLAGKPMLAYPIEAAFAAGIERVVVVVGHGRDEVERELTARFGSRVDIAIQSEQLGTGHAARCALDRCVGIEGRAVILYGDTPLIEADAIAALLAASADRPLGLLTSEVADPTGLGRILRGAAGVVGIREHRDASTEERAIREINPGVYAASLPFLREALAALRPTNAQGELYLTDIVERAAKEGAVPSASWPFESLNGINDRAQLADAEATMRRRIAVRHAKAGVTIRDLDHVYIDAEVTLGVDVVLEPGVILRGACAIGAAARLDSGVILTRVTVEAGALVRAYTVAEDSHIGAGAKVGPFSHLRTGTSLGPDVHIGNFVETKKTTLGRGSKANHLAYLGDGIIGEDVNVGAGTIFCNYDGFTKHTTILEDGAFIGSDSQLIAPLTIGKGAYVATGTTVTRSVPADALAIARTRQENKEGYAPRLKAQLAKKKQPEPDPQP